MKTIDTLDPKPFRKLCMTIGELPTSYLESMTYYEMLAWLCEYVSKNVVTTLNNHAEAIKEIQDWLENLDIQEAVDDKIDRMKMSGELAEIITQYLEVHGVLAFNNVAAMKLAENIVDGSFVQTYGFYSAGDGGGAKYKVRTVTTGDIVDEMTIIALHGTSLIAELIATEANVLQFGAKGDGSTDDTEAFQACANYAESKKLLFYAPEKTYITRSLTFNEVSNIKIEGIIKSEDTETISFLYNHNLVNVRPNIEINTILPGTVVMKGMQSATVKILRARYLKLIADSTPNHQAIAFCKFILGFITYLYIEDDGSGTKYINENIFEGGRFEYVSIGTGDSTYYHENNLFLKPLCENTRWVFEKAKGNIVMDARMEGNASSITWGSESYANVFNQEYSGTLQGYYYPKDYQYINIVDNSKGQNRYVHNLLMEETNLVTISAFNNPKSIPTQGLDLKPSTSDPYVFQSKIVELPSNSMFRIGLIAKYSDYSDADLMRMVINCYDEDKQPITDDPGLLINSPVLSWNSSYPGYINGAFNNSYLWAIIKPNENVKYISVDIIAISGGEQRYYKEFDLSLSAYNKMPLSLIQGLSTNN